VGKIQIIGTPAEPLHREEKDAPCSAMSRPSETLCGDEMLHSRALHSMVSRGFDMNHDECLSLITCVKSPKIDIDSVDAMRAKVLTSGQSENVLKSSSILRGRCREN